MDVGCGWLLRVRLIAVPVVGFAMGCSGQSTLGDPATDAGTAPTLLADGSTTTSTPTNPEECGNGIDDDGDLLVDEGCCVPERCGDGLDNDCDGAVDEGECEVCEPSTEICNGVDDNCDGSVDEGDVCASAGCGCEWQLETQVTFETPERYSIFDFAVSEELGQVAIVADKSTADAILLQVRTLDGDPVSSNMTLDASANSASVSFTGSHYLAVWRRVSDGGAMNEVVAATINGSGEMVDGPTVIAEGHPFGGATSGGRYFIAYNSRDRSQAWVQEVDVALNAIGEARDAGPGFADGAIFQEAEDAVVLAGFRTPGTTATIVVIRDGMVGPGQALGLVSRDERGGGRIRLSAHAGQYRVCWNRRANAGVFCRSGRLTDGLPSGTPTLVETDLQKTWDIVQSTCGEQIVGGRSYDTGRGIGTVEAVYGQLPSGELEISVTDRHGGASLWTYGAFGLEDGRILRMQRLGGRMEFSTLSCGPPPAVAGPEPSCEALSEQACDISCGCGPDGWCYFEYFGGGTGTGPASCYEQNLFCSFRGMDLRACAEALDATVCVEGRGGLSLPLPADCLLPATP